ncbi:MULTISPECIES: hypothetical protein [unclassified Chryseobacterium]|uniref:hypothetical protein n=1 Tax=unclassified Chryseobacterium TaxID=2593645 RepID=UPI000D3D74FA|nr:MULTISPECIES: hypothetical protein [unclassified Chryseobacterium]PTT78257.1 hypothetical protein DBR25_00810 [Chryseobacterium sp. HMWF001]PVV61143.1 hypothetical protein DD829_02940 [Chryseobacterium sp. HMWF035]
MKSKEEIKKYFENGDKPTQEQFWEWQDSYWHKDEKLPADKIDYNFSEKADLIDGKVPASQLPSQVNDVIEFTDLASFPVVGEFSKLYVALDSNKLYRWSGSIYIGINQGDFVPLSGTEAGKPVTGDIELNAGVNIIKKGGIDDATNYGMQMSDYSGLSLYAEDFSNIALNQNGFSASVTNNTETKTFSLNQNTQTLETNASIKFDFSNSIEGNLDEATITQYGGFKYERSSGKFAVLSEGFVTAQNQTDLIMMNVDNGLYANKYYLPDNDKYYVQAKYVNDNFLKLSGTDYNNPITGQLEFENFIDCFWKNSDGKRMCFSFQDNSFSVYAPDDESNYGKEIQINPDGGISSTEDYSGTNNELAFVQKKYVDNNVNLQSVLNAGNYASGSNDNNSIKADPNSEFSVYIENQDNNESSSVVITPESLAFQKNYDSNALGSGFTIEKGGVKYLEDYSQRPEFTDRSLIDKGYAHSKFLSAEYGFSGDLSNSGNSGNSEVAGEIKWQSQGNFAFVKLILFGFIAEDDFVFFDISGLSLKGASIVKTFLTNSASTSYQYKDFVIDAGGSTIRIRNIGTLSNVQISEVLTFEVGVDAPAR